MDIDNKILFHLTESKTPVGIAQLSNSLSYPEHSLKYKLSELEASKEIQQYNGGYELSSKPPQYCIFLEIAELLFSGIGGLTWVCLKYSPHLKDKPMIIDLQKAQNCRKGIPCDLKTKHK